ncbi:MFS transporter [Virgisporangium ochraceum]|uniref:MFS transporter n=1 Tax=Virgisporangium ochraceum TaxID=65505 RepID=A0A8J3ZVN7_9ACTN|nr:MFS transporter [Virgisporangium ochraceum]GIJ68993.1 MFS transporter [Virgisporangium ochraceum]
MASLTEVPLRRNRDFVLLQVGQLMSTAGSQSTVIAYPLLVLAVTGSPALAGVVGFARSLAVTVFALPAGLAADRWNRRTLMIMADAVSAAAVAGLAVAIVLHRTVFWVIPVVAFVEGAGFALFHAALAGALRSVVPGPLLPAAAAVQSGRKAAVSLAGPPLGGALFGLGRAFPFVFDAVSYVASVVSLRLIRTPFQNADREVDRAPLRTRLAEGFRFLWGHKFLRTCAIMFGLGNFCGPAMVFALVVLGARQGLSSGVVGVLVSLFGAGVLVGSMVSGFVRRSLPPRAVILLEFWMYPVCAVYLIWPNVFVLAASMLPAALVIPSTDSVVHGSRYALTPDRLMGRVESVHSSIALLIAPLGPLVAGILLDTAPDRVTIGFLATVGLVLAVSSTLSPSLRHPPDLATLTKAE